MRASAREHGEENEPAAGGSPGRRGQLCGWLASETSARRRRDHQAGRL